MLTDRPFRITTDREAAQQRLIAMMLVQLITGARVGAKTNNKLPCQVLSGLSFGRLRGLGNRYHSEPQNLSYNIVGGLLSFGPSIQSIHLHFTILQFVA